MAIKFTPEQQKVIDTHNCNILVSAAAGSGKTAVLVERIIQMICNEKKPVDIDRLLIVTFTNAAASEMRERISNGISAKLQKNPESEHIQKQAALLHNAQITTIDSFCLFLIRNHFNEIGLDPAFRVADEGEVRLMQQDVMKELLEDAYASQDEDFRYCVEYFCPGGRESVLEQHILNLSKYAASFPWPKEWLEKRKQDYSAKTKEELLESDYGEHLKKYIKNMVQGCLEKLGQVQKLCERADGPYMYAETIEKEIEQLKKLTKCNSLSEYAYLLPSVSFGRLPSKKDESVSPVKRELAKRLRSGVKEVLKSISDKFFATPFELMAKQGAECEKPVRILIDLVLEFDRRMLAKKQERKLIDFSDMEHYALDILLKKDGDTVSPSSVAMEYRQYFHEILIDEYQDSNLVQEYLLKAVSGEENGNFNRFMVGDVKQSIYKFRLARPELFLEKYYAYQESGTCQRIDLAKNFRSRTQVVETVNDIFSHIMSSTVGGIAYDDRAALYVGASYPENTGCESELLLLEKPQKGDKLTAKQAEALAIAQKIKALCSSFLVTDKMTGNLRPVRYGDMVILLRSNSGWDEEFKKVLEKEGIPAYITSRTGYFGATEVQELLQFLRVLDNPRQDIPLFGVMKSIFGKFTEEEIAKIECGNKKISLYEAACKYAQVLTENPDEKSTEEQCLLRQKCEAFVKKIQHYRDFTVYMPIRELLQHLVEDFSYLDYVTALPSGSKRRANVEMLFTKASDFEKSSYFGLFHFIRYMEQLEKYNVDYGEADTLDENADVVRIMSIHKSKGLEFPVTFVAGLSKRFNMQDINQSLILDMDLGLGTDYIEPKKRIRNKTLRRNAISQKMREDNLSEELRVLYVALTRAKEKLILTATLDKAAEKWEIQKEQKGESLTYVDFMESSRYLDFFMPVLSDSKIQVTVVDTAQLIKEGFKEQIQFSQKREALERAFERMDTILFQRLEECFSYQYPYQNLSKLYTKTTVSELKSAAMTEKGEGAYQAFKNIEEEEQEQEILPYVPQFRKEDTAESGVTKGNAYHRVMKLLDFEKVLGGTYTQFPTNYQEYINGFAIDKVAEMLHQFLINEVKTLRLAEEYFAILKEEKILRFLKSPFAYRMWAAEKRGELYREQPFVLGISAKRMGEDFPEEEKVLIQGIIDTFFIENGEIVLIDYKTDRVASVAELWNRYQVQVGYYEQALQRILQKKVKEKILYSFYLERWK